MMLACVFLSNYTLFVLYDINLKINLDKKANEKNS